MANEKKVLDHINIDLDGDGIPERYEIGGGGGGGISELPENLVYYSNEEENIGLPSVNPTLIVSDLDYSTEEQLTGRRWIDGKPVYSLSFDLTGSNLPSTGWSSFLIPNGESLDIENLFSIEGFVTFSNNMKFQLNCNLNDICTLIYYGSNDKPIIRLHTYMSYNSYSVTGLTATILYTKTTDTASSPVAIPKVEAMHNYGTEEKVIGTFNGKNYYRKLFTGISGSGSSITVNVGERIEIYNYYGRAYSYGQSGASNVKYPIPNKNYYIESQNSSETSFQLTIPTSSDTRKIDLVIEYTKVDE